MRDEGPNTRAGSRVLLVISWHPRAAGGVTTAVINLHDELDRRAGCGARLLVDSWAHDGWSTEMHEGRRVWFLRIRAPYVPGRGIKSLAAFSISFVRTALQCRRFLQAEGISVVNIHFPGSEAIFWTLMKTFGLFKGSLVLSFHGADVTRIAIESSRWERALWKAIVRHSTALTACSRMLADELRALFPSASNKVSVLPNGVDSTKIVKEASSPRQVIRMPPTPYVACIAGFEHKKGVDVLLRSFASLRDSHRELRLLLLCRAGQFAAETETVNLIKDLGLSDRVTIHVNCAHDTAMYLLSNAAVLVVPSRREPFGIAVLEAGALGRPVVLTDVCGVLEELDRSLVTVVPPDDVEALAKGISGALADLPASEAQAARLRDFVHREFSWARCAELLLAAAEASSASSASER